MATRSSKPRRGTQSAGRGAWIGGVVRAPAYVTGEGAPYRPDTVLWMDQAGLIVGMNVLATASPADVAANFLETARAPMAGKAGIPASVRVASPDIADALRAALGPTVDVVCAPTPALDVVSDSLRAHLASRPSAAPPSCLPRDLAPDAAAAFFRAGAGRYRAKPWRVVPSDAVLSVSVPRFGIEAGVVSVIGQLGDAFGLLLFEDLEGFDAMRDVAEAAARGDRLRSPRYLALNYESKSKLPAGFGAEVSARGLEVAGPRAVPWPVAIDEDMIPRNLTADELLTFEAIATALTDLVAAMPHLARAWDGQPIQRTSVVATSGGPLEVALAAPHPRRPDLEDDGDDGMMVEGVPLASNDAARYAFSIAPVW